MYHLVQQDVECKTQGVGDEVWYVRGWPSYVREILKAIMT
jgi:hypothetical protein